MLSWLLALCMVLTMLPVSALAVSEPSETAWISDIIAQLDADDYTRQAKTRLGTSDVYMYIYSKQIWDNEAQTFVSDSVFIFQPGQNAVDTQIPDYSASNTAGGGQPWAEANPSAVYIADGVTGIGAHAFDNLTTLEQVEIENSVTLTQVGEYAFNACDNLEGPIDLSGVTDLGQYAFNGCEVLGEVILGEGLTEIPSYAFNYCGLSDIDIPSTVTVLGDHAFSNNGFREAGELELPDGLTTIGDYAFYRALNFDNNSGFTAVTIPSTVTRIGEYAFYNHQQMSSIRVEDDNVDGTTLEVGYAAFGYDNYTAYAGEGTFTDPNNPDITYTGEIGATLMLPQDIADAEIFQNGVNCYTGNITPMRYVGREDPTCTANGYDRYQTTVSGAMTSDGSEVVVYYDYVLFALGHIYTAPELVPVTCEYDGYYVQYCEREDCPNNGAAVGTLYPEDSSLTSMGLHAEGEDTDELTGDALAPYEAALADQVHEAHNWQATGVTVPNMADGTTTTLWYTCANEAHDNNRDSLDTPYPFSLTGKTINALTTQSLSDLTGQLTGFTGGTVSWAETDTTTPLGSTDATDYYDVTFTPSNTSFPAFSSAAEDADGDGTAEGAAQSLAIYVNVTQDVLDLRSVLFTPTSANINDPEDITVSGFGEATGTEDVEYLVNNQWTTTQPTDLGSYTMRVRFTYDEDLYRLPTAEEDEYPGDGYTLVEEGGQTWVQHTFSVTLNQIIAQANPISGLTYTGEAMNTLQITNLAEGQSFTATVTDGPETGTWSGSYTSEGTLTGLSLTEAGTYQVEVTFTSNNPDFADKTQTVSVVINHKTIAKPVPIENLTYEPFTSPGQRGFEGTSEDYTFLNNSDYGMGVGNYTATVQLTNENYRWEGETIGQMTIEIPWSISARSVPVPTMTQTAFSYEAGVWRTPLGSVSGDYEFQYDQDAHTVTLVYIGNEDETGYDANAAVVYVASDAYYTDVGVYTASVALQNSVNYTWSSTAPEATEWRINTTGLTFPDISAEDAEYDASPYDGQITVEDWPSRPSDVIPDGYQYATNSSFSGATTTAPTNAGNYYVRVNYQYNEDNYTITGIPYAQFTISQKAITLTATETTVPYDGQEHTVTDPDLTDLIFADDADDWGSFTYQVKTGEDEYGEATSESPVFTAAGTYTVLVGISSTNYTAEAVECTLTIGSGSHSVDLSSDDEAWNDAESTISKALGSASFTVTGTGVLGTGDTASNSGASISYAVTESNPADGSEDAVVSVDASTGAVTLHRVGTATITVTAAADPDGNYDAAAATYTVTVTQGTPTIDTSAITTVYSYGSTPTELSAYERAVLASGVNGAANPTGALTYQFYTTQEGAESQTADDQLSGVPTEVGSYYLRIDYAGDANYTAASAIVTIQVTDAELGVVKEDYEGVYDGQDHNLADQLTISGVGGADIDPTIKFALGEEPSDWDAVDGSLTTFRDVADSGTYYYQITVPSYGTVTGSFTVTVQPRPLTLSNHITVTTKEYDATTALSGDNGELTATVDGAVTGETITASLSAQYDAADAGDRTIHLTYILDFAEGVDTGNYSYNSSTVTDGQEVTGTMDGSITAKAITVTIEDQTAVYDGSVPEVDQTLWTLSEGALCGEDSRDDLGVTLSLRDGAADAGTYDITGSAASGNYQVTFDEGAFTVTPRPVTVTIGDGSGYYGDEPDASRVTLTAAEAGEETGLVGNDITDLFRSAVAIEATAASDAGTYPIAGTSGQIGNYQVTFQGEGTYTIQPRPITLTIQDHESTYGAELSGGIAQPVLGTDYTAALSPSYDGTGDEALVNGDVLSVTLTTLAAQGSDAGTYAIQGSVSQMDTQNYAVTWQGQTPWAGSAQDSTEANTAYGTYSVNKAAFTAEFETGDQVQNGVSIVYQSTYQNPLNLANQSTGAQVSAEDQATLQVTYAVTSGNSASVAQDGTVTIQGTGTTRIQATVTAGEDSNYTGTVTTWYDLVVITAGGGITVTFPSRTLTYTGEPQALLGEPTLNPSSAHIQYRLNETDEWQDAIPTGTDAGSYTVYWQASASGYTTVSGSQTVLIGQADLTGGFTYDAPQVEYTVGGTYGEANNPLTLPEDYTGTVQFYSTNPSVASVDSLNAHQLTLHGNGTTTINAVCSADNNYKGATFSYTLTVGASGSIITVTKEEDYEGTYDGQAHSAQVEFTAPEGAVIRYGVDNGGLEYPDLEMPEFTDAGTYTVYYQITASGSTAYTGSVTVTIHPKEITADMIRGVSASYPFTGEPIEPDVTVVYNSMVLSPDTDYEVSYGENTQRGTGTVTVTARPESTNYTGSAQVTFEITVADSGYLSAVLDRYYGYYDDEETNHAAVTVTYGGEKITDTVTLTVSDGSGTDVTGDTSVVSVNGQTVTFYQVGTYTIHVEVTGDYEGQFDLSYALLPVEEGQLSMTADGQGTVILTYGDTLSEEARTLTVTNAQGDLLTAGTDYELTYVYTPFVGDTQSGSYTSDLLSGTPAAGVYEITAVGLDSYEGSTGYFVFLVQQRNLSQVTFTVDGTYTYSGSEQQPDTISGSYADLTLTQGSDYSISEYRNNINAGVDTALAVLTAQGNNFTGVTHVAFTIQPKPLTEEMIQEIPDQNYTGQPIVPDVTVIDGDRGVTLTPYTDYTVSASNNVEPGTATVTITGAGNYTGSVTQNFTILSSPVEPPEADFDLTVTPNTWTWSDGTQPEISVAFNGTELTLGTDYTLSIDGVTYDGTQGKTLADAEAALAALAPNEYPVTAQGMGAYRESQDTETVTIQKIQPTVAITADPAEMTGSGTVTLTISGSSLPADTDLTALFARTDDNGREITLSSWTAQSDGSYQATFEAPNATATYTFALTFAGNDYYESAQADASVQVNRRSSGGGGGGGSTAYTIEASAGSNGEISPDGNVSVDQGDDQTFRITADDGYEIADVLVDGESVGAVSRYTFENVRDDHTIEAEFALAEETPSVADPDDTGVSGWLNTADHIAYLTGYPGGLFGPDNSMTRAEVAQMFYALLSDKNVTITKTFPDVSADAWYATAVNTLASLGMVSGDSDGNFRPNDPITRAEFCVIALAFAYEPESYSCDFSDVSSSDWFYPYVAQAASYGWIGGYTNGNFGPNDSITRAQVTTIVNNMLGRAADQEYVDDNLASLTQFSDLTSSHWAYYQIMEATNAHDYTRSDGVESWR